MVALSPFAAMYAHRVTRVRNELAALGRAEGALDHRDLIGLDQYHYLGTAACDQAIATLQLNPESIVLDLGAGIGGTARYVQQQVGCQTIALELQSHLHHLGQELSERSQSPVMHVQGDMLALDHLDLPSADAWLSLLVILHIADKDRLWPQTYNALKPGGRFYIEDYYARTPLSPAQQQQLEDTVAAAALLRREAYIAALEAAGFIDVRFSDMTDAWQQWVRDRSQRYRDTASSYIARHGEQIYSDIQAFCDGVVALFDSGTIGGARIWGRRPD